MECLNRRQQQIINGGDVVVQPLPDLVFGVESKNKANKNNDGGEVI
jgi:hypothetical protein